MRRVAVVTDSNSGVTQSQASQLGLYVIPMPVFMDGEEFFEDINITQEEFFEKLEGGAAVSTSQPAPSAVLDLWNRLLKDHDEIVHIPMSGGLSAACETAAVLARDFDGRVQVVDNRRISVTLRQSALEAKKMADAGQGAAQIKDRLETTGADSGIYIVVNTLKFLKQGGRITPAVAAIGTLLNIKPVLQINGGKLDQYAKVRGMKQARASIIEAVKNDMNGRFLSFNNPQNMTLAMAYTFDREAALDFKAEVESVFPEYGDIHMDPLSLSVSCHIGPGALALTCTRKI